MTVQNTAEDDRYDSEENCFEQRDGSKSRKILRERRDGSTPEKVVPNFAMDESSRRQ